MPTNKSEYMRNYRLANPEKWAYDPIKDDTRRARLREQVNKLKLETGCTTCGYKESPYALDYHHVHDGAESKKNKSTISRMINRRLKISHILKEIENCQLLCANCHRVEHYSYMDNKIARLVIVP